MIIIKEEVENKKFHFSYSLLHRPTALHLFTTNKVVRGGAPMCHQRGFGCGYIRRHNVIVHKLRYIADSEELDLFRYVLHDTIEF